MILTEQQADEIEAEMRRLEADPATTLRQMRLFMQAPMPCGHATGNLLTCPDPPFGCVACNAKSEQAADLTALRARVTQLEQELRQRSRWLIRETSDSYRQPDSGTVHRCDWCNTTWTGNRSEHPASDCSVAHSLGVPALASASAAPLPSRPEKSDE